MRSSPPGDGRLVGRTAGVGLRLPHIAEVMARRPAVGWLEVHPENVLANPHAAELLRDLAGTYPVSLHTVGVSIGSADGLDLTHVHRFRELVDRVDPVLVSGHVAWSSFGGTYLNDLLPLPYTDESLALVAGHVSAVQDALGRQFLVENPSSYLRFVTSTMSEVEFLTRLADQTGCGLLCDVSNIVVSAHNLGFDPYAVVDAWPAHAVGELHLGGFTPEPDVDGDGQLIVDTHAAPIADPAWRLYEHALRRFGWRPTLIEWDADLPSLDTLVSEAQHADALAQRVQERFHVVTG